GAAALWHVSAGLQPAHSHPFRHTNAPVRRGRGATLAGRAAIPGGRYGIWLLTRSQMQYTEIDIAIFIAWLQLNGFTEGGLCLLLMLQIGMELTQYEICRLISRIDTQRFLACLQGGWHIPTAHQQAR